MRQAWALLADESRRAVEVAERYADGLASDRERAAAWSRCLELRFLGVGTAADRAALVAAGEGTALWGEGVVRACGQARDALLDEAWCRASCGLLADAGHQALAARVSRGQESLFRDVVGNPFRRAALGPDLLRWDGGLLGHLARQIYEERRWGEMSVLGDALEDAGCEDEGILGHCHAPGPHVRGCWVLDLITARR